VAQDAANDRIRVTTTRETVTLPTPSLRALLEQIRDLEAAQAAIAAFDSPGAGGLVTLDLDTKWLLVEVIRVWGQNTGFDLLPEGLWSLRHAFIDDLHNAAVSAEG
jgi:hypothetical protein